MADYDLTLFQGCLRHLATQDIHALRLQLALEDEDGPYLDLAGSPFEVDNDQKIGTSKAIRRMQAKTAVFTNSLNKHVRTRLTHSLEVKNIATAIAKILGLNVALARAGAAGHDMAHTPFGHLGENFLRKKSGVHFEHSHFGAVVAERIERKGRGLNLTIQTLQCITNHSRGQGLLATNREIPIEANVVMVADKGAFVFSDCNDVFSRMKPEGLDHPNIQKLLTYFGPNQRQRNLHFIYSLAAESARVGYVSFEHCEEAKKFQELKSLLYDHVYLKLDRTEHWERLEKALIRLPQFELCAGIDPLLIIALMTDDEALCFTDATDSVTEETFAKFGVAEIIRDSHDSLTQIRIADLPKIV